MSHEVLTCVCREIAEAKAGDPEMQCPIPGHGTVPITVEPAALVEASREALRHIDDAIQSVLAARKAWVSRGLPGDNRFPQSLDRLARTMTSNWQDLRRWAAAAATVAERRAGEPAQDIADIDTKKGER